MRVEAAPVRTAVAAVPAVKPFAEAALRGALRQQERSAQVSQVARCSVRHFFQEAVNFAAA